MNASRADLADARPDADLTLRSGPATLDIACLGGRLARLRVDDLDLLTTGAEGIFGWGSYPMAPFAGRVRDGLFTWQGRAYQLPRNSAPHAIHGLVLDRPWQVTDVDATAAELRCDFDSRWPWAGHVRQRVRLFDDHLQVRLEVHVDDEGREAGPMPAWTGHHPWFSRRLGRGETVRFDVPAAGMFRNDPPGIPTGEVVPTGIGPWDDTYVDVAWPATLTWDGALALSIEADTRYGVVFDHRPNAVCVEPQTAPPNATELGLAAAVEPGDPLTMTMTWTWISA